MENDALWDLIANNGGFFSRADALRCGSTDRQLQIALRNSQIVRLRHGMYARAADVDPLDDRARHLLLARAVLASQQGAVALAGPSAAVAHGLTVYGHDLGIVHLLRLDGGPGRRQAGVTHHVSTVDLHESVELHDGILTLNPARTVWDMARLSSLEGGVCAADSALRLQPELSDAIAELAERYAHHPGANRGRLVVRLADGRSESAGESVTRVQFYRHSLPKPDLQVEVRDLDGVLCGTADFGWDDHRHLGEFDGKVKYQKFLREGESPSDCVFREKKREDRMRAQLFGMTRFVWSMMTPTQVRRTMAVLREDLVRSRRLYVFGRAA